ncbi:hypothetical protein DXG01_013802 [Tephrocybe rancida]|nr:hypothetical protein DXG01_013802 [Tephrocybe rancida]
MLMRYHWGLGIGHIYSHAPEHNDEAGVITPLQGTRRIAQWSQASVREPPVADGNPKEPELTMKAVALTEVHHCVGQVLVLCAVDCIAKKLNLEISLKGRQLCITVLPMQDFEEKAQANDPDAEGFSSGAKGSMTEGPTEKSGGHKRKKSSSISNHKCEYNPRFINCVYFATYLSSNVMPPSRSAMLHMLQ